MVINQGKMKMFELMKTIFNFSTAFVPNIPSKTIDRYSIHLNRNQCDKRQLLILKKMVREMFFKQLAIDTEFCVIS